MDIGQGGNRLTGRRTDMHYIDMETAGSQRCSRCVARGLL